MGKREGQGSLNGSRHEPVLGRELASRKQPSLSLREFVSGTQAKFSEPSRAAADNGLPQLPLA